MNGPQEDIRDHDSALEVSAAGAAAAEGPALSFLRRPSILLILDVAAFAICAVLGYPGVTLLKEFVPPGRFVGEPAGLLRDRERGQGGAGLHPDRSSRGSVLIAGLLFELNVSSKFSASDTVNWLPITQAEYVAASALSVAYNYSSSVRDSRSGSRSRRRSTSATAGSGWASPLSASSASSRAAPWWRYSGPRSTGSAPSS